MCPLNAEAVFFGGGFASKQVAGPKVSDHEQAWKTAKIALISTILWVPVGLAMILVSLAFSCSCHPEGTVSGELEHMRRVHQP